MDVIAGLRFRGDCEAPVYRKRQALKWPGAPGGRGANGSNRVRRLPGLDGGGGEFSALCGIRETKRSDPGDIGAGWSHRFFAGPLRSSGPETSGHKAALSRGRLDCWMRRLCLDRRVIRKADQRKLAELCQRPVRVVAAVHRIGSERRQGVSPPDTKR